jgi:hypothetical protein
VREREEGYHLYPGESLDGPSRILIQNKQFQEGNSGILWLIGKCVTHMEGCGSWRKVVLGYTVEGC